jgi:hypothetical protein
MALEFLLLQPTHSRHHIVWLPSNNVMDTKTNKIVILSLLFTSPLIALLSGAVYLVLRDDFNSIAVSLTGIANRQIDFEYMGLLALLLFLLGSIFLIRWRLSIEPNTLFVIPMIISIVTITFSIPCGIIFCIPAIIAIRICVNNFSKHRPFAAS